MATNYTEEEFGLLDAFAGAAMVALIQELSIQSDDCAPLSYKYAEAMVAHRRTLRSENDGRTST